MKKYELWGRNCRCREQHDVWTRLLYIARGIYFLLYTLILVLVVFFRNTMQYVWNAENKILQVPQWTLLIIGAGIAAGGVLLYSKYRRRLSDWCQNRAEVIVATGTILLFFVQMYISSQIYFSPGWDAGLLVNFAQHMENGELEEIMDDVSGYFSLAPNNIMLTIIFKQLMHFSRLTGIFTENDSLMMLITIQ